MLNKKIVFLIIIILLVFENCKLFGPEKPEPISKEDILGKWKVLYFTIEEPDTIGDEVDTLWRLETKTFTDSTYQNIRFQPFFNADSLLGWIPASGPVETYSISENKVLYSIWTMEITVINDSTLSIYDRGEERVYEKYDKLIFSEITIP